MHLSLGTVRTDCSLYRMRIRSHHRALATTGATELTLSVALQPCFYFHHFKRGMSTQGFLLTYPSWSSKGILSLDMQFICQHDKTIRRYLIHFTSDHLRCQLYFKILLHLLASAFSIFFLCFLLTYFLCPILQCAGCLFVCI